MRLEDIGEEWRNGLHKEKWEGQDIDWDIGSLR